MKPENRLRSKLRAFFGHVTFGIMFLIIGTLTLPFAALGVLIHLIRRIADWLLSVIES